MVNLVKWVKYTSSSSDVIRFIVKNIQPSDVVIFQSLHKYKFSKRELIYNISSQCGTGWECPFSNSELITIDNNIFESDDDVDIEYLNQTKHENIILFSFDKFNPDLLRSLICDFGTKSEILGISTMRDKNVVEVLNTITTYMKKGFDESRIRLLMMLENKYHCDIIDMAFSSFYFNKECKFTEYHIIDHASKLWSKQNSEQM